MGLWARSAHWASSNIKNSQGLSAYVAFTTVEMFSGRFVVGTGKTIANNSSIYCCAFFFKKIVYCCASKTSKHSARIWDATMIGLFIIRQKDNNMIGWLFWISMQETYTYLRAVLPLAPAGPHRTNRHRPCRRRGPWPVATSRLQQAASSRSLRHPWATCVARRRTGGPRAPPAGLRLERVGPTSQLFVCLFCLRW